MPHARWRAPIALLTLGCIVLAGCGARPSAAPVIPQADLVTTTPAPVGEIDQVTWNSTYGELASLDPIKSFNYPENQVVANLCEPLFLLQPDFSVRPNLATGASTTDAKTWVIGIRDDVTFWDGSRMTVDDVIFSMKRNLDPAEGSYWASSTTANIASVTQTGNWQITVRLKQPDAVFVDSLVSILGVVVQQQYREQAGANYGNPDTGVMCTGPYRVGVWKQGQSITLERNDDYWNTARKVKAKKVRISFIEDPSAITNSLSTGEIQGSYDVPTAALRTLSTRTDGGLHFGRGMQFMAIIPTGTGAFSDPAVRRALTRATDREAIARTVYEGTGTPSRSIVPQSVWDRFPEAAKERDRLLPDLNHDIAAERSELKQAKVDLTQPITIAYPSERGFYADIINEIANGAHQLGLKVVPKGVPGVQFGAFFSDKKARAGYDGFVTTNYLSSSDPLVHLASIAQTGGDQNYSGFSNAAIDRKLNKARAELDPKKRLTLTVEAEAAIMHDQPWVPIEDLWVRLYMNNAITGAPASFVYLYYPWAADLGAAK